MTYFQRLSDSFKAFWHNPSLLSVMLLEFVARMVLLTLFFLLDIALVAWLNKEALSSLSSTAIDWYALLNARTLVSVGVAVLVELFILLYVHTFFMSGFFGMLKNTLQDGTTGFNEFLPSVKRYWRAIFWFLMLEYGALIVVSVPFLLSLLSFLGTTPQFVTLSQEVILVVMFVFSSLLALLLYFWLLYGEAFIVFDDVEAMEGVRQSARLANRRIGLSLGTIGTALLLFIIATAIVSLLLMPFDYMAAQATTTMAATASPSVWSVASGIANIILNIVTISAGIIISVFIFFTYRAAAQTQGLDRQGHGHKTSAPVLSGRAAGATSAAGAAVPYTKLTPKRSVKKR